MPTNPPASNNQRVTNAVLNGKIDHLTDGFNDFKNEVRGWRKDTDGRLRDVETEQARQDERIDNLNTKVKLDIAGTAIGAAVLALFGITKQ